MTDDETKELRRAVAYAKKIHDKGEDPPDGNALIQGALIRAVEILAADQFPGVRRLIETPTNEPEAYRECDDAAARAVIRAFGGETLQRVREKIERFCIESGAARKTSTAQFAASTALENACSIIDDELAKLETPTDKPARQLRHGLDGCALFENFAGALRVLGFVVTKPAAVDWIEVGGILNEVIDILTKPEVERRE